MSDVTKQPSYYARRKARRIAIEQAWQAKVDAHSGYLRTTYDFQLVRADASSVWETYILYQSPVGAVKISSNSEFVEVQVGITRLVDGKVPTRPYLYPYRVKEAVTGADLRSILMVRAPEMSKELATLGGLKEDQIEKSLAFQAQALNEHCADLLHGDFTLFERLNELIRLALNNAQPTD